MTADERSKIDLRGSPDRFGYEWMTYSTILPESRDQLERVVTDASHDLGEQLHAGGTAPSEVYELRASALSSGGP